MSFVYPNFLWAYLLIAIPIVIHLFNFRRYKTVYFSRVDFLKEVTEDSKSGNKLKHLLVLLSRIIAIICLVTAFAQPFIPKNNSLNTENITSIYIDNSYSMQAEGVDGNLLNQAKNKAIDLVKTLDANEKINLITTDLLSRHQRFYSKSEIIEMIKEVDFSAKSTSLSSVLNLQADMLLAQDKKANERIFIFSDFQKETSSLSGWSRPEVSTFYYQTIAEQKGNLAIDSVWFLTPVHKINTAIELHFRISNMSNEDQIDLPVNLTINGNQLGPKRISISANSFIDDKMTFTDRTTGLKSGHLSIATSQLFFDDSFYFSYEIKEEIKILVITEPNDKTINIEQLYGVDDYYNATIKSINEVSQNDFTEKELILFQNINTIPSGISESADNILKNGGTVVLIPGTKIDFDSWNGFMNKNNLPSFGQMDSVNSSISYFNYEDPLYTGVFDSEPNNYKFPKLFAAYDFLISGKNNFLTLFGSSISKPFLYYGMRMNGRAFVMSAPLVSSYTDFQNHALFAATFLRIAETASFSKPLYMNIGELSNFPLNRDIDEKNPIHILHEEYNIDAIPQIINNSSTRSISFSHLEDVIKTAGVYQLNNEKDFEEILAINYNRKESKIEAFETEEIDAQFGSCGWVNAKQLELNESGKIEINTYKPDEYWRILLILSLVFIGIEILLLKFWKS